MTLHLTLGFSLMGGRQTRFDLSPKDSRWMEAVLLEEYCLPEAYRCMEESWRTR